MEGTNLVIYTKELVDRMQDGDALRGVCLIKDYKTALTKQSKPYFDGTISCGTPVTLRVWEKDGNGINSAFAKLQANNFSDKVVLISGTVSIYMGVKMFSLTDVIPIEGYSEDLFDDVRYSKTPLEDSLRKKLGSTLTEKGLGVLNRVLFTDEELYSKFTIEYAAKSHHDNCKYGLLAHTVKCVFLTNTVITSYPALYKIGEGEIPFSDYKDLYLIGATLHDIGKTMELSKGTYSAESCIGHSIYGVEILSKHKEYIVEQYGIQWYLNLITILTQHHGQYGDRPKTVFSYIIHLVDLMESRLTALAYSMDSLDPLADCPSLPVDLFGSGDRTYVNIF